MFSLVTEHRRKRLPGIFYQDLSKSVLSLLRFQAFQIVQYFERCRKCEANGSGPLFNCGVAKHLKSSTHEFRIGGK